MSSDTAVTITREDGESKGRYVARVEGIAETAEMTYSRAGTSRIIIDHTGVPTAMCGMGVGEKLVRRGVEDARKEGVKLIPLCPFAKATIEKHEELQDVLN